MQDICSLRAQKEDEKVELLNLEKEKAALAELLATVRRQKEKEQVTRRMVMVMVMVHQYH